MAEIDLLTLKFHSMIHIVQLRLRLLHSQTFICLLLHLHFAPKRNSFEHFHFQIGIDYCCLCFAHHVLDMMFEFELSFNTSATEREREREYQIFCLAARIPFGLNSWSLASEVSFLKL